MCGRHDCRPESVRRVPPSRELPSVTSPPSPLLLPPPPGTRCGQPRPGHPGELASGRPVGWSAPLSDLAQVRTDQLVTGPADPDPASVTRPARRLGWVWRLRAVFLDVSGSNSGDAMKTSIN